MKNLSGTPGTNQYALRLDCKCFCCYVINISYIILFILGVRIRGLYLTCISMSFELSGDMCAFVSRCGTCFWDNWSCVTKSEKDSKMYIERVPGSEQGFEHLTKHKDMVVS